MELTKYLLMASVVAAPLCSTVALAAETATMEIRGTIVPTSCDISLNRNANVDLGTIPVGNLEYDAQTVVKSLSGGEVIIICPQPARVGFSVTDNQAGTALPSRSKSFGLGSDTNNPGGIGSMMLAHFDSGVTVSGAVESTQLRWATDKNSSWTLRTYPNSDCL